MMERTTSPFTMNDSNFSVAINVTDRESQGPENDRDVKKFETLFLSIFNPFNFFKDCAYCN